jgi:hypothetical protein
VRRWHPQKEGTMSTRLCQSSSLGSNEISLEKSDSYWRFPIGMREWVPGWFARKTLMAVLHVYCDESGKFSDSAYISFCGFIGRADDWEKLCARWWKFLEENGLPPIHMKDAVHFNGEKWLQKKREWGTEAEARRDESLCSLSRLIHEFYFFCVGACIDADHFRKMNDAFKHDAGDDPYYMAFLRLLGTVMKQSGHFVPMYPGPINLSLIIDDEEKYSIESYKLLNRIKLGRPDIKARVRAIGFVQDDDCPGVQAADMLAYGAREKLISGKASKFYSLLIENRGEPDILGSAELDAMYQEWRENKKAAHTD